jgi:hypothetical protein
VKIKKAKAASADVHTDDIAAGEVFMWRGSLYLRIDDEDGFRDSYGEVVAGVRLEDGSMLYPDDDCRVVKAHIVVEGDSDE